MLLLCPDGCSIWNLLSKIIVDVWPCAQSKIERAVSEFQVDGCATVHAVRPVYRRIKGLLTDKQLRVTIYKSIRNPLEFWILAPGLDRLDRFFKGVAPDVPDVQAQASCNMLPVSASVVPSMTQSPLNDHSMSGSLSSCSGCNACDTKSSYMGRILCSNMHKHNLLTKSRVSFTLAGHGVPCWLLCIFLQVPNEVIMDRPSTKSGRCQQSGRQVLPTAVW